MDKIRILALERVISLCDEMDLFVSGCPLDEYAGEAIRLYEKVQIAENLPITNSLHKMYEQVMLSSFGQFKTEISAEEFESSACDLQKSCQVFSKGKIYKFSNSLRKKNILHLTGMDGRTRKFSDGDILYCVSRKLDEFGRSYVGCLVNGDFFTFFYRLQEDEFRTRWFFDEVL